jgi:hypothetical protein
MLGTTTTKCYADGIGPCLRRGQNSAIGVDYSGDLTQRQSRRVTQRQSRRVRYFCFFIAFSILRKIKENAKKFKK